MNNKITKVLYFDVPDRVLGERITGRRIHKKSGRTYHIKFKPPVNAGKDDITGETLIQRKDDTLAVLKQRLKTFHGSTKPLLQFYKSRGLLAKINANQRPSRVWVDVKKVCDGL